MIKQKPLGGSCRCGELTRTGKKCELGRGKQIKLKSPIRVGSRRRGHGRHRVYSVGCWCEKMVGGGTSGRAGDESFFFFFLIAFQGLGNGSLVLKY